LTRTVDFYCGKFSCCIILLHFVSVKLFEEFLCEVHILTSFVTFPTHLKHSAHSRLISDDCRMPNLMKNNIILCFSDSRTAVLATAMCWIGVRSLHQPAEVVRSVLARGRRVQPIKTVCQTPAVSSVAYDEAVGSVSFLFIHW